MAIACLAGVACGCNTLFGVDELRFGPATASGGADGGGGDGAAMSAGGGGSGGDAGEAGGAGGSGGDPCGPVAPSVHYEIARIESAAISVDGTCDEDVWTAANVMPFVGGQTSSNTTRCVLVWSQSSASVFGCCDIVDDLLTAAIDTDETDPLHQDDSIEYFLSNDLDMSGAGLRPKLQINARGAKIDADYSSGAKDPSFEMNPVIGTTLTGTLNDLIPDTGWTVEWRADIGFSPALDEVVLCDVLMNDNDAGTRTLQVAVGPGTGNSFNDPTTWGQCRFACSRVD